jgi:hypothetical protein
MVKPLPGSEAELERFASLQSRLGELFRRILPDRDAPRTVVVNPSLSLDPEILTGIKGLIHYEERMLCMLMLLKLPQTRVVYLSSAPIDPSIVDYYLHLLPCVHGVQARRRLVMLSCHDPSTNESLTDKLLGRPRMLARIRRAIGDPTLAHMSCFNVTSSERSLAVQLGIPIYGNDPEFEHLGSKSGSRRAFRDAGVDAPPGHEDLRDEREIADALVALRTDYPGLTRAAVKLDYGVSGEGNATFSFEGAPSSGVKRWVEGELGTRLVFEDSSQDWERYRAKFREMGGVVEAWIDGANKRSPSAQCRIDPLGEVELVSTHDQVLGGPSGQVFLGCTFPADEAYRLEIQEAGRRVGEVLRDRHALGRYGVDFVSVQDAGRWRHHAIEVNLRKGGTTHTFRILQLLTGGDYDAETGLLSAHGGEPRYYHATDNLESGHYRRLTPDDLVEVATENDLHFHVETQSGVFFHLIGALAGYGKLGAVCVESSREAATRLYEHTVEVLDRAAAQENET